MELAIITTYPPRRCGIATFSRDLIGAVTEDRSVRTRVIALDDEGRDFPTEVAARIRPSVREDHGRAAARIAASDIELISIQHEFGIYGGPDGAWVLDLADRTTVPLVTTFHTVLMSPSASQREVMTRLIRRSSRSVVMSQGAADRLVAIYDADPSTVVVIPHGVPDLPPADPRLARRRLGLDPDRPIVLSFGLLGPGKGYELAIDAMARVRTHVPDARYVVLGSTHPEQLRVAGETYRHGLQTRAAALDLREAVDFVDEYLDPEHLAMWLQAAEVYITPYPGAEQIVSGTLAYAVGAGLAIVSTPYAYAREVLAGGRGTLVPFGDPDGMAAGITRYLVDGSARAAAGGRAYAYGRAMTWTAVGARYRRLFAGLVVARPSAIGGQRVAGRIVGRRGELVGIDAR